MSGAAEGIAGLALSAISIAALFQTCVDCYSLVVAAKEFGKNHELLCTELSLQKLRFFLWGESVGLATRSPRSPPQPNPGLEDPIRRATIIRTLNAIKALLSETQEMDDKYGFKADEYSPSSSRGLSIFRATFDQFKLQARRNQKQKSVTTVTRWAIFDAADFETKITRLKSFIDGLENVTKALISVETQHARLQEEIESISDAQSLRLLADAPSFPDSDSRKFKYTDSITSADVISSNHIELIPMERGICNLIEVDMFSMWELLAGWSKICKLATEQVSQEHLLRILENMVNDVRRLYTRSPQLFRMSTRAIIARSENIRYGTDRGEYFFTLATNKHFKVLAIASSSFYLGFINGNKSSERERLRPIFLQLFVLLLSFLGDKDLGYITNETWSCFEIAGDRECLELIIMKVLPLSSHSPPAFLEGLFAAYKPHEVKESYEMRFQPTIWKEFNFELLERGFIVPALGKDIAAPARRDTGRTPQSNDIYSLTTFPSSIDRAIYFEGELPFAPEWPLEGITSSTIFKYLQNDEKLREPNKSMRCINHIPRFQSLSDEPETIVTAIFANDVAYRLLSFDAEQISLFKKGTYTLHLVEDPKGMTSVTMEIEEEDLTDTLIKSTKALNSIVVDFRSKYGGVFGKMPEPAQAYRVTADIVSRLGDKIIKERCAQGFRLRTRLTHYLDLFKDVHKSLGDLEAAASMLKVKVNKRVWKNRSKEKLEKLVEIQQKIQDTLAYALKYKEELVLFDMSMPQDPVSKIIFPDIDDYVGNSIFFDYQSQLTRDKRRLILKARRLVVKTVEPEKNGDNFRMTFVGIADTLLVERLTFPGTRKKGIGIAPQDHVALLGHFLAVVIPIEVEPRGNQCNLVGYLRILKLSKCLERTGAEDSDGSLNDCPLGIYVLA
jgi:hypothetical protein